MVVVFKRRKLSWGHFTNMQSFVVSFLKIQKNGKERTKEQCSQDEETEHQDFS